MTFDDDQADDRERGSRPGIAPGLPLALLESLRTHDRPREVLADEDLAASMPRRLGLTGVVDTQIRRYERAERQGRRIPVDTARDLLRLVLKRPDSEAILREAGERFARRYVSGLARLAPAVMRIMPGRVVSAVLRRAVRRMFKRISGRDTIECDGRPLVVRVDDALTAGLEAGESACVLYTAALEELIRIHTGQRPHVLHTSCATDGRGWCEWRPADAL